MCCCHTHTRTHTLTHTLTHTHTQNKAPCRALYLGEAADEGIVFSTGVVLRVQAVVEAAGVADGHAIPTDIELHLDAASQIMVTAGKLNGVKGQ